MKLYFGLELLAESKIIPAIKLERFNGGGKSIVVNFFPLPEGQLRMTARIKPRVLIFRSRAITRSPDHPIFP